METRVRQYVLVEKERNINALGMVINPKDADIKVLAHEGEKYVTDMGHKGTVPKGHLRVRISHRNSNTNVIQIITEIDEAFNRDQSW